MCDICGFRAPEGLPPATLAAMNDVMAPFFAPGHEFSDVDDWYTDVGLKSIHKVARTEVSPGWAPPIEHPRPALTAAAEEPHSHKGNHRAQ